MDHYCNLFLMTYFEPNDVLESNQDHNYLWLVEFRQDYMNFVYHRHVLYDLIVNIDKLKSITKLRLQQGICRGRI